MSATTAPYGLEPAESSGGSTPLGASRWYPLTVDNVTGIFRGDPVRMASGVVIACAATPTTSISSSTPWGIFLGCEYDDAVAGHVFSPYLPASSVTGKGYTNIMVNILPTTPLSIMKVQADGAVAATAVGKNAALVNFGAGSTVTGKSKVQLGASTIATTSTLAVRIIEIAPFIGNVAGDAYTDVYVMWNFGVAATQISTGA